MPYDSILMGSIIAATRKRRGLSQETLSGLAGTPRSHLAAIEAGNVKAGIETLWKIADALGVPLSELIRLSEEELLNRQ